MMLEFNSMKFYIFLLNFLQFSSLSIFMSFEVTLKVRRYSKEKGSWWQEYKLNRDANTVPLGSKESHDPTYSEMKA